MFNHSVIKDNKKLVDIEAGALDGLTGTIATRYMFEGNTALETLPEKMFNGLMVHEIILTNNGFTSLSAGLLTGAKHIETM